MPPGREKRDVRYQLEAPSEVALITGLALCSHLRTELVHNIQKKKTTHLQ